MRFKHFVALNAMDVLTTLIAINYISKYNPEVREINPIYAYLFVTFGLLTGLVIFKSFALVLMHTIYKKTPYKSNLKLLKYEYNYNPRQLSINIGCLMYIVIVLNNSAWIIKNIAF